MKRLQIHIPIVAILLSNCSTTAAELLTCALRLIGDLQHPTCRQDADEPNTSRGADLTDRAKLIGLEMRVIGEEALPEARVLSRVGNGDERVESFLMSVSEEDGGEMAALCMMDVLSH